MYASAQSLDFLATTKKSSFPNWKPLVSHPDFPDGHQLEIAEHQGALLFNWNEGESKNKKP